MIDPVMPEQAVKDAVKAFRFPDDFPLLEGLGRNLEFSVSQLNVRFVDLTFWRGEPIVFDDPDDMFRFGSGFGQATITETAAWDLYEPDLCVDKINERMLAAGHRAMALRDAEAEKNTDGGG